MRTPLGLRKLNPGLLERWRRAEDLRTMARGALCGAGLALVLMGLAIVGGALLAGVPLW